MDLTGIGRRLRAACAMIVGLGLLAACAQGPLPGGPAGERAVPVYRLGSGDRVRIIVFNEPTLTGEFDVSSAGTVSMPLIGEIKAQAATTTELQTRIAASLAAGYLKDPRVSVEVLNYRPFYILGEVGKPGSYPYTNGLTVLNAVATANGFTYRADQRHVFIKRDDGGPEQAFDLTTQTPVAPGDTIRIGERYF